MVKAEDIKMLTPTDKQNIENFDRLSINHQRVFKHRLIQKCQQFQKDFEFVLLNLEKLNLKVDKITDIVKLKRLLELYGDLSKLQNM
jgi:hypothetical protein